MMGNLTSGLQTILQILPLGDWLTESPYGIVYGALLFDALSGLILLLSRLIFKEYFSSSIRKGLVIVFAGGTVLLTIGCYVFVTMKLVPILCYTQLYTSFDYLLPVYHGLTLIAYLFFIGYLIDFIIRLVRRGKKKKGGDIAAE